MSKEHTRRSFLRVAGAGAAWVALAGATGCEPAERASQTSPKIPTGETTSPPVSGKVQVRPSAPPEEAWSFRTRPDLKPPAVTIDTRAHDTVDGFVFVAPKKGKGQFGCLILDDAGEPVWFRPLEDQELYPMDFKVQSYGGEPVITWCESKVVAGHGFGEYVIADTSYREITRVQAGNGYKGDHHEFVITPHDTALFTAYGKVRADLTSIGGEKDHLVWDCVAQELDIETGKVLFEWHCIDHVPVEETYGNLSNDKPGEAFCYFHINSIDVDHDGNLLISSRNTWTIYKVDRETGEIIWRLGGRKSDFEVGPKAWTRYQHHARRHPDGTISIFDNGGSKRDGESFGIVVEPDMDAMTSTLVRRYAHPDGIFSDTQGSIQLLQNGNVFVGWGSEPNFSEFSHDGDLLFSATFPNTYQSYRAFRFPWTGRPDEVPAVMVERVSDEEITVYASWNGATEVAAWQVLAGPDPERLQNVGAVARNGFETAIEARTNESFVSVRAIDFSNVVIGTSKTVEA